MIPSIYLTNNIKKASVLLIMSQEVSSSFTTWEINRTTFAIREDDAFKEHPIIYAKLHQKAPILVLSDTGTDEASEKHRKGISIRSSSTIIV